MYKAVKPSPILPCRANADEMATTLQELGSMQVTASDLRSQILSVDANLNQVGRAYLRHLLDTEEHSTVSTNLQHSKQVCSPNVLSSPLLLCIKQLTGYQGIRDFTIQMKTKAFAVSSGIY